MDNTKKATSDRGIRLAQRNAAKESLMSEDQEDRRGDDRKATTLSEYPSAGKSASSQNFHPSTRTVPDSFALPAFSGTNTDADTWLVHFRRYAGYRQLSDADIVAIYSAIDWFDTLSTALKNALESLLENFTSLFYFGKTAFDYVFTDGNLC